MIRILIIDDNLQKQEHLRKALKDIFEEEAHDNTLIINTAETINVGVREAYKAEKIQKEGEVKKFYDYIFVDNNLPRFTDTMFNIETNVASEIIDHLWLYQIPSKCIIFLAIDSNEKEKKEEFENIVKNFDNCIGYIIYNPISVDWHFKLLQMMIINEA